MIVTSKRCFLNVLTQYTDISTLIKAHYYILDCKSPDMAMMGNSRLEYDMDGQLKMYSLDPVLTKYNIKYGDGELDPTQFITNVMVGAGSNYEDPYERFRKHLLDKYTLIKVYSNLFKYKLNGLQIIVIYNDEIVQNFGNMICEYLSNIFGADIEFLDAVCRPHIVKGKQNYVGNKQNALLYINKIRDEEEKQAYEMCLSHSSYESTTANLSSRLGKYETFEEIIHLYELLFPNNPLPPDNYTVDQIKQIIIGLSIKNNQMPKDDDYKELYTTSTEYLDLISRYENESADFSLDDSELY